MRRMYAHATTTNYDTGAPYSSGRIIRDSSFYYSPSSSYSRSPSFDGTITGHRMYGGSSYSTATPSRPMGHSSDQRPLRISSSYGDSGGSIFTPSAFVSSSPYGRYTTKPPLGSQYGSTYRTASDYHHSPSHYGSSSLRYPRSASVDRGSSPMSYIPMDSRTRYDEDVRSLPGQVHHITTRLEKTMIQRSDSFERSPIIDRRASPFREPADSLMINGYRRSPAKASDDIFIRKTSYGRSPLGGLRQRRTSESSEESNSESRDALSALPHNAGYRIYRNQQGATSMPDVPMYSSSNGKATTEEQASTENQFARNDPVRNSSSSVESTDSVTSSGQSTSSYGATPGIPRPSSQSGTTGSVRLTARERRRMGNGADTSSGEKQSDSSGRSSPENQGKAGLLGLQNIGNTCFMNSVLQCLSHTKPLRDYCLKGCSTDINNNNSRMKGSLIKAFTDLMGQLWSPTRATYIIPDHFKGQIQRFAPRFVGYSQQDAQEFLRYVLQGFHEDVNRIRGKAPGLPLIEDSLADSQKAAECWKRYLRVDDSKIVDLFVGQLKSELKCTSCGHVSTTFDPFWDLSLPIPQSRISDASLYDCLDAFTKEEILDGDEKPKCEKCKTRRKCTKRLSVYRFPQILVLHLKRFSGERFRSRLSTLVEFPVKNLDMTKYSSAQSHSGSCSYSLYAVSNHTGTPLMGHYTAYAKHAVTGKWHYYDDGRVSNIENRSVVSSEAYVLFYELKDRCS